MSESATISREDAVRFSRVVGLQETLPAISMLPMAGNFEVDLSSLEEVEGFLVVVTPEEAAKLSQHDRLHWIAPPVLASWVRDVIGDMQLAAALDEVADTDRPYGLLVPDMKRLISERLAEYRAALGESDSSVA